MATTVDFMASRIGPKWFSINNNVAIRQIRDTIQSTLAATPQGLEGLEGNCIPQQERVP